MYRFCARRLANHLLSSSSSIDSPLVCRFKTSISSSSCRLLLNRRHAEQVDDHHESFKISKNFLSKDSNRSSKTAPSSPSYATQTVPFIKASGSGKKLVENRDAGGPTRSGGGGHKSSRKEMSSKRQKNQNQQQEAEIFRPVRTKPNQIGETSDASLIDDNIGVELVGKIEKCNSFVSYFSKVY